MRLRKELDRKPTKEEVADCIKTELFKIEHGLVEEKRGRPRHEAEFLDTVMKKAQERRDRNEVIRALQKQVDKEVREETSGVDLRFWKDSDEPTREEQMKELSEEINKNLEEKSWEGICPRCKSSVCRCEEEE